MYPEQIAFYKKISFGGILKKVHFLDRRLAIDICCVCVCVRVRVVVGVTNTTLDTLIFVNVDLCAGFLCSAFHLPRK